MSILSDLDIKKYLGKDIVIEPLVQDGLTPVGYDFHVGNFVHSLESGILKANDGVYMVPPKNTVRVLTRESLWVSGRIAGLFHSKVSLVSKGWSHIATTLDPNWYGPLLITLRNNTDQSMSLGLDSAFVTLVFFKVLTPTKTPHHKRPGRKDLLMELDKKTAEYFEKIEEVLGDVAAAERFQKAVEAANAPLRKKIPEVITKSLAIRVE